MTRDPAHRIVILPAERAVQIDGEEGGLSDEELALYRGRLKALIPDTQAREWLEGGGSSGSVA